MQLQKIELKNFRQFKNTIVEFATDEDKNVTLIIGDNGTGKTTFAQAFTWCLYGKTTFNDNVLLNLDVKNQMIPGDSAEVKVILTLQSGEKSYQVIRKVTYVKTGDRLIAKESKFTIGEKMPNNTFGNWIDRTPHIEIKQNDILPEDLLEYFFFDGEKIEKMSEELLLGRKNSKFAEAVKKLTGLKGYLSAKEHLSPNKTNSAIALITKDYKPDSSGELQKCLDNIAKLNEKIAKTNEIIDGGEEHIEQLKPEKLKLEKALSQLDDARELQKRKDHLSAEIEKNIRRQNTQIKELFGIFADNMDGIFALPMTKKSLKAVNASDLKGMDIPEMRAKTIEFLLARGTCICGTKLKEGDEHYRVLQNLIQFLPPQAIGVTAGNYVKDARNLCGKKADLRVKMAIFYQEFDELDGEISSARTEIDMIDEKLSGSYVTEKTRELQAGINEINATISKVTKQVKDATIELGGLRNELKREEERRHNLAIKNGDNLMIEMFKDCALRIYKKIAAECDGREIKVRRKLQKFINDYYREFFNSEINLNIDESYKLSMLASGTNSNIETSTAQGVCVVFAFLAAVLQIAKESSDELEDYPLVTDAPLSTFDKDRIKVVCETLPRVASQVIIFIKNTDGDIAEQCLDEHIGKKMNFVKRAAYDTTIV